jgi:hypothetical protein
LLNVAVTVLPPSEPTMLVTRSYPPVPEVSHSGQSRVFCHFQFMMKSSAETGVPSFQTASGLILYVTVNGLSLVTSADVSRSVFIVDFRSGAV